LLRLGDLRRLPLLLLLVHYLLHGTILLRLLELQLSVMLKPRFLLSAIEDNGIYKGCDLFVTYQPDRLILLLSLLLLSSFLFPKV
jgi:hypothetical protein